MTTKIQDTSPVKGYFIVEGNIGAGKSTFLHILGTLDRPTLGRIFYYGDDLVALPEGCHLGPHGLGDFAADVGVDFVEHEQRDRILAGFGREETLWRGRGNHRHHRPGNRPD